MALTNETDNLDLFKYAKNIGNQLNIQRERKSDKSDLDYEKANIESLSDYLQNE